MPPRPSEGVEIGRGGVIQASNEAERDSLIKNRPSRPASVYGDNPGKSLLKLSQLNGANERMRQCIGLF